MEGLYKDKLEFEAAIKEARNTSASEIFDTLTLIKDLNFQEGDILIKYEARFDYNTPSKDDKTWSVESFSAINSAPRKYQVIHVDEVGLHYITKISMSGDYCGDIKCIAGFNCKLVKFDYDPDFLDHLILAEKDDIFDPQEIYKEKRDEHYQTKPRVKRKIKQDKILDGNSGGSVPEVS